MECLILSSIGDTMNIQSRALTEGAVFQTQRGSAFYVVCPFIAELDSEVEVALDVGANTITVTVTAEDGTTQDYTLTITRAAA